jgi:hypothetical protein
MNTVEGAITVVFGIVCFFFMPDTPAAAGFLSDEEKEWALRRMRLDAGGSTEVDVDDEKFSWYWVKMALKAPQTYLSAFIWFFLLVPLYVTHVRYRTQGTMLIPDRVSRSSFLASLQAWVTKALQRSSSRCHPTWLPSSRSLARHMPPTN